MCEYEENLAAVKWEPGTVVRHIVTGRYYTITADDCFFSHQRKVSVESVRPSDYTREERSRFEVVS